MSVSELEPASPSDAIRPFCGASEIRLRTDDFAFEAIRATGSEDDVGEHTHEAPHFLFMLEGAYISSAKDAPDVAYGPCLFFHPAWTTHRDRVLNGHGRFLGVSLFLGEEGHSKPLQSAAPTYITNVGSIYAARAIVQELRQPSPAKFAIEAAACQLIGSMDVSTVGERSAPAWLGRAKDMIVEASSDQLTISGIARDAGVHPVYLARTFRRFLGCTPGEYLRARRLERAAHLLGRKRHSIAEVAVMSGFSDQSHLTKVFRAAFGTTPGLYRRRSILKS